MMAIGVKWIFPLFADNTPIDGTLPSNITVRCVEEK